MSGTDGDYMIGDIMLSQPKEDGILSAPYPTRPIVPVHSEDEIVGLTQKIVKIADGLMLGYAGSLDEAISLIVYLKREYSLTNNISSVVQAYEEHFLLHRDKYLTLQTVISAEHDNVRRVLSRNCYHTNTVFLGNIVVLGTGTDQFVNYIRRVTPPQGTVEKASSPTDADKIVYVLDYISSTIKNQHATGLGIDRAWGGGFEIALKKNGKYLEKVDDILFHGYLYKKFKNDFTEFFDLGLCTYQFYNGEDFVICTQFGSRPDFYRVPPPTSYSSISHDQGPGQFDPSGLEARPAQLVFIKLQDMRTGLKKWKLEYTGGLNNNVSLAPRRMSNTRIRIKLSYLSSLIGL